MWEKEWTIAGVAKTGKYRVLNEPPRTFLYVSERQNPDRSLAAIVRTTGDPRGLAHAIERASAAVDSLLKPMASLSLMDHTSAALAIPRMAATLLTATGAIALFLAGLGIYGVMSYSVGQRTREIGVRMALGAQTADVLRLFVGQGMRLAAAGLALGLAGAMAAGSMLASVLVGVSPSDPLSYSVVIAGLAGVCFLATYLPSRRATLINPLVALRQE
jgi:ABC-type antimicrobial peptide transport system permease subunit